MSSSCQNIQRFSNEKLHVKNSLKTVDKFTKTCSVHCTFNILWCLPPGRRWIGNDSGRNQNRIRHLHLLLSYWWRRHLAQLSGTVYEVAIILLFLEIFTKYFIVFHLWNIDNSECTYLSCETHRGKVQIFWEGHFEKNLPFVFDVTKRFFSNFVAFSEYRNFITNWMRIIESNTLLWHCSWRKFEQF